MTNKNRIIDDHSNWLTASRVVDYLNRVDKIPHRSEGELLLCEFISKKQEFSPHMLNEFRREFLNDDTIKIIEHDLTYPLPTNLGKFDAIISSFAIHHLMYNRKRDLYSELFSMLKPGGIFCNLDHISSESKTKSIFQKSNGTKAYRQRT
ncbi:MAG TPA: class I SAM-dependent methyltransferase [Nitrososphaeraceae archaeon]|nr:class I SAM-dependent methyltransferase [Nitrososphaeraceae archaeon]